MREYLESVGVGFFFVVLWMLVTFMLLVGAANAQSATQTATFNLTWVDNSGKNAAVLDNEDGFHVERRLGTSGTFAVVGTTGPNITTYSDPIAGDTGGTQYCYRVNAFNKAGTSAYSNIACATTPQILVTPGAPTNVSVSVTVTVTVP